MVVSELLDIGVDELRAEFQAGIFSANSTSVACLSCRK